MARLFDKVDQALPDSLLIAWDGCHKIYLAMDDVEAAWFKEHYTYTVEGDVETKSAAIHEWWYESCGLRFISAVNHNQADPNAGYVSLISQFEDECPHCDKINEDGNNDGVCDDCLPDIDNDLEIDL